MWPVLEALILVTALSTDAFVASFAYGANKIRIPAASVAIITAVSSGILAASLLIGQLIRPLVPTEFTKLLCFAILLLLGVAKLFDSSIKSLIRTHKKLHKKFRFSMFHLNFMLNVYANPEEADCDCSHSLSPKEALPLAFALSLDGLAVGFGAAFAKVNLWEVMACSLVVTTAAVIFGCLAGNKVAEKADLNLSWLGGALLILLAFLKLR